MERRFIVPPRLRIMCLTNKKYYNPFTVYFSFSVGTSFSWNFLFDTGHHQRLHKVFVEALKALKVHFSMNQTIYTRN